MIENTYLLWDIKADDSLVRIVAWTEQDALEKAERILPERKYVVVAVCEHWLPGMNVEAVAKAMEKIAQPNTDKSPT